VTARALVTGATGFIGRALCAELLRNGWQVRAAVRRAERIEHVEQFTTGELAQAEWSAALEGVDTVFHLAAAVHSRSADAVYRSVNVDGTERLAKAAVRARVRRFVFVSTIKVNGEATVPERPFRADDAPAPHDAYASSKWQAEQVLATVASGTKMEVAIVRPPLVYGAGVRANFLRLLQLVDTGFPLPFASIRNRRSLVYVGNLVSLLRQCASHSSAPGRTFLVADGEDMSTPGLVRRIAAALGREPRLLPFPPFLLPAKLSGSLVVDAAPTFERLAWRPPYSLADGLFETVAWYRSR
jgi:nucleoside-diphosphate-sugar epimerase